MQEKWEADL